MPKFMRMTNYIGGAEAAALLGVDRSTLTRWAAAGKIAATRIGPGLRAPYIFARDDVERLAAERHAEAS